MGNDQPPLRAEFPPARYWRRWCEDAPAPVAPASPPDDAQAVALRDAAAHAPPAAPDQPAYRVLVVEDDRSQALFAETVLNGAGMQVRVAPDAGEVLDTLEAFAPDLVLMDLHMPAMDGVELTHLIRAHPTYAHVPIVFLTGEADPERQFEALEVGADDVLTKPVRPRHLIAAIGNRIKRARLQTRGNTGGDTLHPVTGLFTRNHLLQQLAAAVPGPQAGALYFIEVVGATALRDRIGYAPLEAVLIEAGRRIGALAEGQPAARLNDSTFLVHVTPAPQDLTAWARHLRDGLAREPFDVAGEPLRLRASVGVTALDGHYDNAGSALAAAEQALRQARGAAHGIAIAEPPLDGGDTAHALSSLVSGAAREGKLELAYQPVVAVAGGDQPQFQTLLRVRDADGTLHTAAQILPVAEAAGLLHDIDRHVLDQALTVLSQQQGRGTPVRLFVSQSPRTLARDGYAQRLLDTLEIQGTHGQSLVLDVRQDDALVHAIALQEFCTRMVPAGVQLCLSQYRPGPEADALLAQLPLSFVRLSGHFSRQLGDQDVRDQMRQAIDHAHRLGLQVIGQQVEDPQAAATLWMSGIDFIQGNLVHQVAGDLDFDFHLSVL